MKTPQKVELELGGRPFSLQTGRLAQQASGAVEARLGDTVVLVTATLSEKPREGVDFLPLTCDFEERYYAAGKIKGSRFVKREGRPSENAVLHARMIDRPLRPLFPKDFRREIQVIATILSCDLEVDPGVAAINAASAALLVAGAPFEGPVGAVKIGLVEGQFVVNPTYEQEKEGDLSLTVVGSTEALTMVEAGSFMMQKSTTAIDAP